MFGWSVNLCIYIVPGSQAEQGDRIFNHVRDASNIWQKCNITICIKKIQFLTGTFPNINAVNITNTITLPNDFVNLLRNNRQDCNEDDIAVYYIPGNVYNLPGVNPLDQPQASFHFTATPPSEVPTQHSIIMSDGAVGRVLAHELGHALLLRERGAPCSNFHIIRDSRGREIGQYIGWGNDEPDPNSRAADCKHHTDPNNLMEPHVNPGETTITDMQRDIAVQSRLARHYPSDFRVEFQMIDVHFVNDGLFDQELESNWIFNVWRLDAGNPENAILVGTETWDEDHLNPKRYIVDKSIPFSADIASDVIRIEVFGTDTDTVSDDPIPRIVRDYDFSTNWGNWGVGVGSTMEPLEGPIRASNDQLDYSLHYKIFSV
ncbi:TPA: hypothetical protein QCX47_005096 [Bacillus mycoides]|nr:hypothetical protein [Bacillus mycoides]